LRGGLLAAATLVLIDVLKELPLTLILRPFDFETLATRAYRLAGDELVPQAAVPALVMIAVSIPAVLAINGLTRRSA
jgi:iron(III) transport system permease protein